MKHQQYIELVRENHIKLGQTGPLDRSRRTSMLWCKSSGRTVSDSRGSATNNENSNYGYIQNTTQTIYFFIIQLADPLQVATASPKFLTEWIAIYSIQAGMHCSANITNFLSKHTANKSSSFNRMNSRWKVEVRITNGNKIYKSSR